MSNKVSASIITYNEAELLPRTINYLLTVPEISEICVLDSNSTDGTQDILKTFAAAGKLRWSTQKFESFYQQRNDCVQMTTGEWIVSIDADETYSKDFSRMLREVCLRPEINAIRIPTVSLVLDENHCISYANLDPHVRVWRKSIAQYRDRVHETLYDIADRNLHTCPDSDILSALVYYPKVILKHAQMLKSSQALTNKGERWETLGMLEESAKKGMPLGKRHWQEVQSMISNKCILELPKEWE